MTTPVTSEARVSWADLEELDLTKLNNISTFAQQSIDNAIQNLISSGILYADMNCAATIASNSNIPTLVTVQPGYMVRNGIAYPLRDAFNVDVSRFVNQVPDSSKTLIVIIAVDGQEGPLTGNETFLNSSLQPTDPNAYWPTTELTTPLMVVRSAIPSPVGGVADVQPTDPTINPILCPIARVTIGVDGIESVVMLTDSLITPVDQLALQVAALNDFEATIAPIVSALRSSVSALALQLSTSLSSISSELARQNERITAIEQKLSAPTAVLRGVDFFTDLTQTDVSVSGYAATVSQGVRFPAGSATADITIVPQAPYAASLEQGYPNYLIPAFTEVVGAVSLAFDRRYSKLVRIAWNAFPVYAATFNLRGFARWRVRWSKLLLPIATSQLISAGDPAYIFAIQPSDLVYDPIWGDWRVPTVEFKRLTGFWRDLAARGFWTQILASPSSGGVPVLTQAYTPSGSQMITSVDVAIERNLFSAGAVRMVITKSVNGNPDATQMLADVTVADAAFGSDYTTLRTPYPILAKGGETIHFHFLTSGGHRIRMLRSDAIGAVFGGPCKAWSAGGWVVVSAGLELGMRINVAQFNGSSTTIPVQPLGLTGGIDTVDVAVSALVPDGCSINYEAQVGGVYMPVGQYADPTTHPLAGRPNNLPLNIVLGYTPSVAPIIDLTNAKARVTRASTTLQHDSSARLPAVTVGTIVESVIVDNYNATYQTLTARLRSGTGYNTLTAPTTVVDAVQSDGSLLRTFTWTSLSLTNHKVELQGVTTDSTSVPTVRQASWYATT